MTDRLMDRVLIALGELMAERRHREEDVQSVGVEFPSIAENFASSYCIVWNTGNTMDIVYYPKDRGKVVIATINLSAYRGFYDRSLAYTISGILSGHMYQMNSKWEAE